MRTELICRARRLKGRPSGQRRVRLSGALAALALAALLVSPEALAQEAKGAESTIVSIEQADLIVDTGSLSGATQGTVVELWRPVRLRHPVTGRVLIDRFRLGQLRLVQVQRTLSIARAEGELSRPPATGDVVVLPEAKKPVPVEVGVQDAPKVPVPAGTSEDPEEHALSVLFTSLKGKDPKARIQAYEDYVYAHPRGRFVTVLWEEAQALRALDGLPAGKAPASKGGTEKTAAFSLTSFAAPERAQAGKPLALVVEIAGSVAGAVLHVRRSGLPSYVSFPMKPQGAGYYAATVPAEHVQAPSLDYFIEVTGQDGKLEALVGGAAQPNVTPVEDARVSSAASPRIVTVSLLTDYASFNTKKDNDSVFQTEGVAGVRFSDVGLRAVRSGFGVFRGKGGTLAELDQLGLAPRDVGLTYGYLEAEYAFAPIFSVVGRGVLGLRESGVGGGAQAFVRIGNDRRTNLLFGGETLGGVGVRGITQLEWNTFPKVPIVLRTEVTNQPAGSAPPIGVRTPGIAAGAGEVGLRLIGQVGYRVLPSLVLAGRASYQGRTITHAGPGAGAAVTYEW